MGRAARFTCNECGRQFTLEFFQFANAEAHGDCLFCLKTKTVADKSKNEQDIVQTLKRQNNELHEEIKELRNIIKTFQERIPPNTNTPPSAITTNTNTNSNQQSTSLNDVPFKTVRGVRSVKSKHHQPRLTLVHKTNGGISTNNRFEALEDEMESFREINTDKHTIIGDSIIRNMGKAMNKTKHPKGTTYVHPGATINRIEERVRDMRQESKKSCTVVCVGSNDIYKKKVASQDVVEKYRELISSLKDRFNNTVIIGTLPRHNVGQFALSRAIGINNKLEELCKEANIGYIDTWVDFIHNRNWFCRDGTHLNQSGTNHLATLVSKHITAQLKANFR